MTNTSDLERKNFEQKYRLRLLKEITLFRVTLYELPEDINVETALKEFGAMNIIKLVEPNLTYELL